MGRIFRTDGFKNKKQRNIRKNYPGGRKHYETMRMVDGFYAAMNAGRIPHPKDGDGWYFVPHRDMWRRKYLRAVEKKYRINLKKWAREETAVKTWSFGILSWAPWLNYHRQKYLTKGSLKRFNRLRKS